MRMRVALAAVALLGTGCSGAGADRPFTPGGDLPSGGTGTVSAGDGSAEGTPTPLGARALSAESVQTVPVAPGMNVSVEWPSGLDATQQALAKVFVDGYVSSWKAVTSQGQDTAYLAGVEDQASRDAYGWVRGFVDRRESVTGLAKLYGVRIASVSGRGAEVDACVDESGVRVTEADTGRPMESQPAWTRRPAAVYLQIAAVRKGDDGVYRIKAYLHASYPQQRAKECRR
ncbi:hypothetical protein [Sphaerisporangium fuscum]|uniref:hypothetical protein n=1 Tax=Sphaerisporangium fuscum TaxID=2835868 RepID=UPI001BDD68A9|nr:hypothetical protein [Sphaerisporangium fuscum]